MELELAVAVACETTSCRVRLMDGETVLDAHYADAMQDRIKVRPGDLVAIDKSAQPLTVVWRWHHAIIERIEGDHAVVTRNVTQRTPEAARRGAMEVDVIPALSGQIQAGDTVFLGGDHRLILDVARQGLPAHPERIRAEGFPEVLAAWERMASA